MIPQMKDANSALKDKGTYTGLALDRTALPRGNTSNLRTGNL